MNTYLQLRDNHPGFEIVLFDLESNLVQSAKLSNKAARLLRAGGMEIEG